MGPDSRRHSGALFMKAVLQIGGGSLIFRHRKATLADLQ